MNSTEFIAQLDDQQKAGLKASLGPLVAELAGRSLTLGENLELAEPEGKGVLVRKIDRKTSPVVTWIKACSSSRWMTSFPCTGTGTISAESSARCRSCGSSSRRASG